MYWKYWGKNVRHPADSGVWAGRGRTVMGRADSAVRRDQTRTRQGLLALALGGTT